MIFFSGAGWQPPKREKKKQVTGEDKGSTSCAKRNIVSIIDVEKTQSSGIFLREMSCILDCRVDSDGLITSTIPFIGVAVVSSEGLKITTTTLSVRWAKPCHIDKALSHNPVGPFFIPESLIVKTTIPLTGPWWRC